MASPNRRSETPLIDQLFAEGHRFDFFQAVALLERFAPDRLPVGETGEPGREAVRFEATIDFGFPASDVISIQRAETGKRQMPRMRIAALSLGGPGGPLPNAFTEIILDRSARKDHAAKAFLDIFHHRLVSLLYRVRARSRLGFGLRAPHRSPLARYLFSLIGLGTPALQGRMGAPDRGLLPYAGLLAGQTRSIPGLEAILQDCLDVPVKLRPYVGRWLHLDEDQTTALGVLGRNNRLGDTAVVGSRVWDNQSGFTLAVGPLPLQSFESMLPIGPRFRAMVAMTRFYCGQHYSFEIELTLRAPEVPRAVASAKGGSRLGWTSWLGAKPRDMPGTINLRTDRTPMEAIR